jgi:Ca2+-binding RTX toxin-like protein
VVTAKVSNVNDAPTGGVTISGTAKQGEVLTAGNDLADADGMGMITYEWQLSTDGVTWSKITGATGASYQLTTTEVGRKIRVIASYTDNFGIQESVSSVATLSIIGQVVGTLSADVLTGTSHADILIGMEGNDYLNGGAGADNLIGGTGNDTYVVESAGDEVVENAGEGTDQVQSSVTYALGANVEKLILTGSGSINGRGNELSNAIYGNSGSNGLEGGGGDDALYGYGGDDHLDGGTGNDMLYGQGGSDMLEGGTGDDYLNGGEGADKLIGGTGNDTYVVESAGDEVVENAGEGTDMVQSSVTYELGANVEKLILTGSGSINGRGHELSNWIYGNSGANMLDGGSGNDTLCGQGGSDMLDGGTGDDYLNGGEGSDTMSGGLGNDSYVVESAGDEVVENAGEGTDMVQSSVTYALGANVEKLILTGSGSINGRGNELSNAIYGNSISNGLEGGGGDDALYGYGGDDHLDGGTGNDMLYGGAGNDTYCFGRGDGHDVIVDSDAATGNRDVLAFAADVGIDQLWFRHSGNDLLVSIIGSTDNVAIRNWYSGTASHVEQIRSGDGKVLADTNIDALVQAMAVMSAPAAGQTVLTTAQQIQLAPVLAANWN